MKQSSNRRFTGELLSSKRLQGFDRDFVTETVSLFFFHFQGRPFATSAGAGDSAGLGSASGWLSTTAPPASPLRGG
jgi:hypothetical protein